MIVVLLKISDFYYVWNKYFLQVVDFNFIHGNFSYKKMFNWNFGFKQNIQPEFIICKEMLNRHEYYFRINLNQNQFLTFKVSAISVTISNFWLYRTVVVDNNYTYTPKISHVRITRRQSKPKIFNFYNSSSTRKLPSYF